METTVLQHIICIHSHYLRRFLEKVAIRFAGRIPSVRELAVEMEVNPNTVMRSFELLQNNDIIYNKRGIGYFISAEAEQRIREMRHKQFVKEVLPAVFKEMQLLDINLDELTNAYALYLSDDQ